MYKFVSVSISSSWFKLKWCGTLRELFAFLSIGEIVEVGEVK